MHLIVVEVILSVGEIDDLMKLLKMVDAYDTRYKAMMRISANAGVYNRSRNDVSNALYDVAVMPILASLNILSAHNLEVRMAFAEFNIDYDFQQTTVLANNNFEAETFAHAIIKVIVLLRQQT